MFGSETNRPRIRGQWHANTIQFFKPLPTSAKVVAVQVVVFSVSLWRLHSGRRCVLGHPSTLITDPTTFDRLTKYGMTACHKMFAQPPVVDKSQIPSF